MEVFKRHMASRKREPIPLQQKKVEHKCPPNWDTITFAPKKNKLIGQTMLAPGKVMGLQLSGDRQWIRLEFSDAKFCAWLNTCAHTLGAEAIGKQIFVSRFCNQYGRTAFPLRIDGDLAIGATISVSIAEFRAYEKDGIHMAAELGRDIIVHECAKTTREDDYFSDGD